MRRKTFGVSLFILCLFAMLPMISQAQEFCWKDSYGRGVGTVPKLHTKPKAIGVACPSGYRSVGAFCAKQTCKNGKEADGGLCYKPCNTGYKGVGPVCWTPAPDKWKECGMGAAKDAATCGMVTGNQVVSTLSLAYNVNAAATAGQANSAMVVDLKNKLASLIEAYEKIEPAIKVGSKVAGVGTVAANTNKLVEQPAVTAEDIIRLSAQIMALVDPTGASAAVAAYTYPTCDKYFPGVNLIADGADPSYRWGPVTTYNPNNRALPPGVFSTYNDAEKTHIGVCQALRPNNNDPVTMHPGKLYAGKCEVPYGQNGRYLAEKYYPLMAEQTALTWRPYSLDSHRKGIPLPALTLWSNHYKAPMSTRLPVCRAQYKGGWHPGKLFAGTCRVAFGTSKYEAQVYDVLTRNLELWGIVINSSDDKMPPNAFLTGYENGVPLGICRAKNTSGQYPNTWHPGKLHKGQCKFPYGSGRIVTSTYQYLTEDAKDLFWVASSHELSQGGRLQLPGAIIGGHENERPLRICRASYEGAWHAGKIYAGSCDIAYGNKKVTLRDYEVLLINRMPDGFAECAKENSPCYFNGTVTVYFGDMQTNRWTMKQQTGSFTCNLATFGQDPAPYVGKACYIPENAIPRLPLSYTQCAPRGSTCNFKGTVDVLYGSEDHLMAKAATDSIMCDESGFGGDPAPGVAKSCYIPSSALRSGVPVGLRDCAPDNGTCIVPGEAEVFYGTSTGWRARQVESETVCSTEVFGDPGFVMRGESKRCMIKHNVAQGKPVTQSSVAFGGVAERAVDGSADGIFSDNSVTHTSYGAGREEWLEVDLQGDYVINAIKIYNRLDDCCKNRIVNARVEVYNGQRTKTSTKVISQADDVVMFHDRDINGRYVRIISPVGGVVSVAEVEVFGTSRL